MKKIMRRIWFLVVVIFVLSSVYAADLLVFGGDNHDVFLGCLSCSKYASDSMLNQYGDYGSKYSSTSIFNDYGTYGSKYSQHSPCNKFASDPPVVVDRNGGFYGYLTLNRFHPQAITDDAVVNWLEYAVCE